MTEQSQALAIIPEQALPMVRPPVPVPWQDFNGMVQFAQLVPKAPGLFPKHITTWETALIVMQKGIELGIPPMHALATIYTIGGKASVIAETMLALIYTTHGDNAVWFSETTNDLCTISYKRRGWKERRTYTYTIDDAARAGMVTKGSNYEKHPAAMIRAKCITAVARMGFPDVIAGMRTPEELDQPVTVEDGVVVYSPPVPDAAPPRQITQRRTTNHDTGEISESLPDAEELAPSDGMLAQLADREFLIATFFGMIPPPEPPATVSAAKARYDHAGQVLKGGLPNPLAPATEAMMAACLEKTQALITAGGTGQVLDEGMTVAAAWARYQQDAKVLKGLAGKPASALPASAAPLATEQQINRLIKLHEAVGRPCKLPADLTDEEAAALIRELIGIFNSQSRGAKAQASARPAPNPGDPAAPPANPDDPFDGQPF